MRNRGWAMAVVGLGALVPVLAACGSSATNTNAGSAYGGSGSPAPTSSAMSGAGTTSGMGTSTASLTIRSTKIGKVLTDAKGNTLYWYAKDTKDGPSTCTGSCLKEWPIVTGKAVAAPGVKLAGVLGAITDPGGTVQASYNGYPLYTYAGDMSPGDTTGNGAGGVWHVITGSTLTTATGGTAATPAKSPGSGGYGYGAGYGAGVPAGSGASGGSAAGSADSAGGAAGRPGSGTRVSSTTAPAPAAAPSTEASAPAPTSSVVGGNCGEGACW